MAMPALHCQMKLRPITVAAGLPQIEVAVAENSTALIFRVLDPPTDDDTNELIAFGAKHELRIYLQPGGLDSLQLIQPAAIDEPLYYSLPEFDIRIEFEPIDERELRKRFASFSSAQLSGSSMDHGGIRKSIWVPGELQISNPQHLDALVGRLLLAGALEGQVHPQRLGLHDLGRHVACFGIARPVGAHPAGQGQAVVPHVGHVDRLCPAVIQGEHDPIGQWIAPDANVREIGEDGDQQTDRHEEQHLPRVAGKNPSRCLGEQPRTDQWRQEEHDQSHEARAPKMAPMFIPSAARRNSSGTSPQKKNGPGTAMSNNLGK